jgi:ABC-type lipoprotein release transport system permease subunit
MVFFLAFRNMSRNKKDSAIIALLIAVVTFLFFIGNSIIGRTDLSMRRMYIESLTGDVVLEKSGDVTMNLFFFITPVIDAFFIIPVLPAYDALMEEVSAEAGIEKITSQVSGKAYLDVNDMREPALLCGVDAESYFSLFPGIILKEGRFLRDGEYGAMITADRAQRIEMQTGQPPLLGMPLLFTSGGAIGFKIREVPLVGIFRYQNPGQFMNDIVIIDAQTVRVLNSIQVAGADNGSAESVSGLFNIDTDDLFSGAFTSDYDLEETEFSADLLQDYLNVTSYESSAETGGDWNFILLRLKKGSSANAIISSLNKKLEPYGVSAVNWRIASGASAILTLLVQALFNSGIFIVSVVGVIAIINILLISVFRRVREIGTLRAIGASDFYIRSLIYSENMYIALASGFAGVCGGALFLQWINSLNIQISNDLLVAVLDRTALQIEFMPHIAFVSFTLAVFLVLAAGVYPVETAVRIEPETAVRRG